MEKKCFEVLRYLFEETNVITQKLIAEQTGYSVGSINSTVNKLLKDGLIDADYHVTKEGLNALEPYKVDNAIILAAGMSSRFIPISYNLPKGLISVKGEVLIERQIQQLQQRGINEIVVVLGYMMEKFFYLREKYNIKIVVNNEYAQKNTHSSVYAARDYCKGTYICSSDNYYPENMFHKYEYRSYYCAEFLPGISYTEYGIIFDSKNLIIGTEKPSKDKWIMIGHAYFSRAFSEKFIPILVDYYGKPGVENMYWENVYAENVRQLPMYILKCKKGSVWEFDCIEELKKFDPHFINYNKVGVLEHICKILCCEPSDISEIEPIPQGITNRSFKFKCGEKHYVYRHPGMESTNMINRKHEAAALRAAKRIGLDRSLIYIDEDEGWKISKYLEPEEEFSFENLKHIQKLADLMKTMHQSKTRLGFPFDFKEEADKLIERLRYFDSVAYFSLIKEREKILPFFKILEDDPWQISMCHNDIYGSNLLLRKDGLYLIDWEFAGDADIGHDICKLFSTHGSHYDEIDKWLFCYYGRETTKEEKIHLLSCAAIKYYYWYVWGIYMSHSTEKTTDYLLHWYDKMNFYEAETMKNL